MKIPTLLALTVVLLGPAPSWASPLSVPTTDSYRWTNGDTKWFELSWDGSLGTFDVEDLGTATYTSLRDCCADTFDRVQDVYPNATLTFTGLSVNTMPVDTTVAGNLDLNLMSPGTLDNLFLLTGHVTLQWDDPYTRMPILNFVAGPEMNVYAVPEWYEEPVPEGEPVAEPASLILLASGLLGGSLWSRRRSGRIRQG